MKLTRVEADIPTYKRARQLGPVDGHIDGISGGHEIPTTVVRHIENRSIGRGILGEVELKRLGRKRVAGRIHTNYRAVDGQIASDIDRDRILRSGVFDDHSGIVLQSHVT